jgi:hypothetical protein
MAAYVSVQQGNKLGYLGAQLTEHREIIGNEKAEVAKHSIRHGRDSQIPIPAEDMKRLWRRKSKEESQLWHQEVGQVRGRQYFTLLLDKGPNPWFAKCKLNRRAVTSICRLRSGHTALAHSLARFNIVPNGICTCGTSEETPDHVFWQYQRFTQERKNLTKGLLERWNALPQKMDVILIDMDPSDVNILGAFINAAKIRI